MVKSSQSKVRVADNLSEVSCVHKDDFTLQGFNPVKQLNLDNYLLRNSPWKTYWKIQLPDGKMGFAKVNYGYPNERTNYIMGKKEALLSYYFSKHIKSRRGITVPELVDHWGSKSGYFVVFKWEELRPISLQFCLGNPILIETLSVLLRELNSLPPPRWRSIDYEVHNFAGTNNEMKIRKELAPFGFD